MPTICVYEADWATTIEISVTVPETESFTTLVASFYISNQFYRLLEQKLQSNNKATETLQIQITAIVLVWLVVL
jgi:hypothetical protein